MNKTFYICTNVSENGYSTILYKQMGIVGYYKKVLNKAQKKYLKCEKEFYVIMTAVENWEIWIEGSEVVIKTENKNILGQTTQFNKKNDRWRRVCKEYDI